ncbi:hypothetical protein [Nereida sp.]|uniref:hypothetical protein n=1 Tax=Nereida sp. TaxID=2736090 RepID=UPI003F698734
MSNTDSFVEEVTDELRNDQLYAAMRKYGWIAALAVVAIVGGASWNEYSKAQAAKVAQAKGDALLSALTAEDPAASVAALGGLEAQSAASTLLFADAHVQNGETSAALAAYDTLATSADALPVYRQLAQYKALMLRGGEASADERRMGFETLATPGAPFRLLAEEQLGFLDIEAGNTGAALERFERIIADGETSAALRRRASQAIVALGGSLDGALSDS